MPSSYGDELLEPRQFPRTVRLFALLQILHEKDERALQRLCREEGLVRLEAGSARAFVRSGQAGTGSTEVFFLGSEADCSARPEAFAECWLRTNASIELVPLDASICLEPGSAKVHRGFQTSYLGVAPALREALQWPSAGSAGAAAEAAAVAPGEVSSTPADRGDAFPGGITLVGYSLGGALATLAAAELACAGHELEVITFGSPRVGDAAFRDLLRAGLAGGGLARWARFVNALDLVPHVPFSPDDTEGAEAAADGGLWRGIELAMAATLPQSHLVGSDDQYHHVLPSTRLDGLVAGMNGLLGRLAGSVTNADSALSFAARLPVECLSSHALKMYASNLRGAPRPAWLVLATSLLASRAPAAAASAAASLLPRAAASVEAAALAPAGARPATGAVAVLPLAGVGAVETALGSGTSAMAGVVLPQVLGAAVSAYGCYRIGRRLEHLSGELRAHAEDVRGSVAQLAQGVAGLSREVLESNGRLERRLEDMGALLHHQRIEDFVLRARVARRQIAEDLAVFFDGPSASRVHAVRDGARELRRAVGELLEVAAGWQEADTGRTRGAEIARLLGVATSGSHLALLAAAVADEADVALRASQALGHLVPALGRFYWAYLATGTEPWAGALSTERGRFLGLALALAASRPGTAGLLEQLRGRGDTPAALFAALGLNPEDAEVRTELALTLAPEAPGALEDGGQSAMVEQRAPAARTWLLAQVAATGGGGSSSSSSAGAGAADVLFCGGQEREAAARARFLAGLAHLVPVAGLRSDPRAAAALLAEAGGLGAELAGPLRTVHDAGAVRPEAWEALASAAREAHHVPLALQLCGARVLPEAADADLREWLKAEVSVGDLPAAPAGDSGDALQRMAEALARDAQGVEDLLGRSREVFEDLAEMLQVATAHLGQAGQEAIEEVKRTLDRDLSALNEEKRYVLFGGLVSAGKTTLVNALLLHLIPHARDELKEDRGGKLNLMPTSYNENTRIVTEVELTPHVTEIEVRLLESLGADAAAGQEEAREPSLSPKAGAAEEAASASPVAGFTVAEGYPVTFAGPRAVRKLQKHIRDVCETEAPDNSMRRLHVRVPCSGLLAQPVSIIDTPGLDSPTVWQQIRSLVHSKAFLFVWVGAVDAAMAFGLQGRRLVELYRSTGHPLPPVLVLTKWDRLKALPEFQGDAVALASQVQFRLAQLRTGLLPPDRSVTAVRCTRPEEIEQLVAALELLQPAAGSGGGCEARWALTRSVAVGVRSVYKGSVLLLGCNEHGGERGEAPGSAAGYLRELTLPASVHFGTEESEALLLLASVNAAAAVARADSPERQDAEADLSALWGSLIPLLSGLSEPLRISRRLHKIVVATQRVVNILLKDDKQAMVFGQSQGDLEETQRKVVRSFSERVDQYFHCFPSLAQRPEFVPAGCVAKVSLQDYRPPEGLERRECATCLIPTFIREAHVAASHEKSQFRYVKAVATVVIERWQSKFLENMMRLERDCLMQLQSQISDIMSIHGLIDHCGWQADLQSLITSPIEAVGFGCLAGSLVGGYCGLIAEAVAGVGLGVGLGLGVLVAAGVAAVCFEDSALAKNLGVWTYEEGQICAAQTVLDVLNKPDFRAKAKELVLREFQRRLQACMDQLADLRDPVASGRAEAQAALGIQRRVAELQRALSRWFAHFVGEQVGRDPWLVSPPADLRAALAARSADAGALPTGPGGQGEARGSDSSDSE